MYSEATIKDVAEERKSTGSEARISGLLPAFMDEVEGDPR